MLFVSFDFLLFIIPVLLLAWALANVAALGVLFLIAASYFFYMAGPHTDPIQPPWYRCACSCRKKKPPPR